MKQLGLVILSLLSFCISETALASDSGAYVGVGVSDGFMVGCPGGTANTCNNSFNANSKEKVLPKLIGGYDFNKYIGVEGGYSQLGTYKVQNAAGLTVGSVKASAFTLAVRGGYKFDFGLSLFGKLGLASVNTKYSADPGWVLTMNSNQRSSGAVVGLGGGYDINDAVGLRINLEEITFNDAGYSGAFVSTNLFVVFKLDPLTRD